VHKVSFLDFAITRAKKVQVNKQVQVVTTTLCNEILDFSSFCEGDMEITKKSCNK
jgi:hypothetical protein